jgi:hypothetical protein
MGRLRLVGVGLCLASGLALSTVALVPAASAGEYRWCQKVGKKKGQFLDSKCTLPNTTRKKGEFEKISVEPCVNVGKKNGRWADNKCTIRREKHGNPSGEYEIVCGPAAVVPSRCAYTSTGGAATLETPAFGPNNVTCKASTDVGEVMGDFIDYDRITFTGCEFLGLLCQSAGPNGTPSGHSGVIVSNLLDGVLIDFPGGPVVGEVWHEFDSGEHEPYLWELECGGVVFLRTLGNMRAVYKVHSLNTVIGPITMKFEATPFTTLFTEAFGPPWSLPAASTLTTTVTDTYASEIEVWCGVSACVGPS